jgi:hypothetical protein
MTLEQLLSYCIEFQDSIFVRDTIDGETDNYPLSTLTFRTAARHIARWLYDGRLPHRSLVHEKERQ